MLAGVTAGAYRSLEDAKNALVREAETFYPRKDYHKKHEKIYQRYRNPYTVVRPLI